MPLKVPSLQAQLRVPPSRAPAFHIQTRSQSGLLLTDAAMPNIWLSNGKEGDPISPSADWYDRSIVRIYSPAWKPRAVFRLEAEAKLITRRFIKSSDFRDTVLRYEPEYVQRSLYPIVEIGQATLNNNTSGANITEATSIIRVTLRPGLENYYRSQEDFWNLQKGSHSPVPMCDYIEDYRAGNALDALGSIGGLFALLHAAHVLLFGRPLLWGLTGAKLITPFGLLGAFSSGDFKRRLQEHYHRQPTHDNPEPLRIGAFLRDFVIDFGPANISPKDETSSKDQCLDSNDSPIPLVQFHPCNASTLRSETNHDLDQGLLSSRDRIRDAE
ncbi:hypothetical protein RSOLAG1IB_08332 [Rhizoctonia solani AG-1 IB]|uniref:Uncharacterized protein n=1 Tax=Thanatephorus cucumeris (strain AG1-IB / isolate 7/3/14) TaxID=1108050 RepID=A0A0B7FLL3_THACB|nr:hypothetical protein RSOLAG1IB_08332 [Rhizoctonia solani AG-1 IB]